MKILVTYASKYGATAVIAEKIAGKIKASGFQTDLIQTNKVENIERYDAVILGSAVYIGQWLKKAVKFLKANEKILSEKKVWLFSSGPTGEGDPVKLLNDWKYPKKIESFVEKIKPTDTMVFHGSLDEDKLNSFEKWILKKVKAPVGDFRDWEMIDNRTQSIIDSLKNS